MSSESEFANISDEELSAMITGAGGKVHDGATRAQLETAATRIISGDQGVDTLDGDEGNSTETEQAPPASTAKAAAKPKADKVVEKAAAPAKGETIIRAVFLKDYFPEKWPRNFRPRANEFDRIRAGEELNMTESEYRELRNRAIPKHPKIPGDIDSHIVERAND